MADQINKELQAFGSTQILVYVKTATTASASAKEIRNEIKNHFIKPETSQDVALARANSVKLSAVPAMRYYPNLGVALGTVNRAGLTQLRQEKEIVETIKSAPQISLIRPATLPVAATLDSQYTWGIEALGIPEVWNAGFTGKNVWVGHLDTGVDGSHPALKDAVASFAYFDDWGDEVKPTPDATDTDDHGTHTAGTIAGRPVGGRHIGVAPDAKLASATVIENGNVVARVLGGMEWSINKGVKVLSMSLGLRGWFRYFLPLTRRIRQRNILPVFAVGNEGPGTSRSPGNYSEALSVGAYGADGEVAWFSSSQRFNRRRDPLVPDLIAPGVDIISAKPGGGYQSMPGTSMATPHIAGLAALMFQAKPNASVLEIEKAILNSCVVPNGSNPERISRGIPFAPKALELLLS